MKSSKELFVRRRNRTRGRLKDSNPGHLRLSIFRSGKHIYAQVIDDRNGTTLASASSMDKDAGLKSGANVAAAATVGKLVAERAKKAGIEQVVFDRGGHLYHGRIKALAEGAREGGLKF
jgi:large subunit ribosomal protein L18